MIIPKSNILKINKMKKHNELGKEKYFANKGLNRNKSSIANIRYKIEILEKLQEGTDTKNFEQYKFKDEGYLVLY